MLAFFFVLLSHALSRRALHAASTSRRNRRYGAFHDIAPRAHVPCRAKEPRTLAFNCSMCARGVTLFQQDLAGLSMQSILPPPFACHLQSCCVGKLVCRLPRKALSRKLQRPKKARFLHISRNHFPSGKL
jgi:hypothetical protein